MLVDVLRADDLAAALRGGVIGSLVEVHAEIDSTNVRALVLAGQGAPDGTLVLAERQTAGRGRQGRRWHAPSGSSLLMSVLLRPPLAPDQAHQAMMIVALAAVEAIAEVAGLQARLKWPNDVLLGGRKVGGLLTELGLDRGRLAHVVVGLGLNVNLDPATLPEACAHATSLSVACGHAVDRRALLLALARDLNRRYARLCAGWSPQAEWRQRLETIGRQVRVGGTGPAAGLAYEGVAEDVDEEGALLVRLADGSLRRVLAEDVTLGHTGTATP